MQNRVLFRNQTKIIITRNLNLKIRGLNPLNMWGKKKKLNKNKQQQQQQQQQQKRF